MSEWDQSEVDPAAYEERLAFDEREEDEPADEVREPEEEPEDPFTTGQAFVARLRQAFIEFDNVLAEAPEDAELSEIEAARDELSKAIDRLVPEEPGDYEPRR